MGRRRSACSAAIGFEQGEAIGRAVLFHHLLAAAMGLLGFEATSALAERLVGRPALGLGDAKLAALLGAWLGLAGLGARHGGGWGKGRSKRWLWPPSQPPRPPCGVGGRRIPK